MLSHNLKVSRSELNVVLRDEVGVRRTKCDVTGLLRVDDIKHKIKPTDCFFLEKNHTEKTFLVRCAWLTRSQSESSSRSHRPTIRCDKVQRAVGLLHVTYSIVSAELSSSERTLCAALPEPVLPGARYSQNEISRTDMMQQIRQRALSIDNN
ncbi:hypothetical protein J6590_046977 [Homalodisca vitripennis]|nr:hypothetical protein J6590_046977 [Homalodisca vitripennis]